MEPMTLNRIIFYDTRTSQLHLISQCELLEGFTPLTRDLPTVTLAARCLEMVDQVVPLEVPQPECFTLLHRSLESLSHGLDDPLALQVHFTVRLLRLAGFQPQLDRCTSCSTQVRALGYWSPRQGGLLCAVAERSASPVGIDTSLAWLIVAGMALRERGFQARLAAAHAEALPLADGWAGAVVSLDVIEHVSSPEQMLGEVDRVIRPGGVFLLSTPNRYSLGAEPHVGVWGVGWLPRGWQAPYVKWRRGDAYAGTQLLSGAEIARLVRSNTSLELSLDTPSIPEADIAVFKPYRVLLARIYNRLAAMPVLRPLWLRFAPFYRATCTKR